MARKSANHMWMFEADLAQAVFAYLKAKGLALPRGASVSFQDFGGEVMALIAGPQRPAKR